MGGLGPGIKGLGISRRFAPETARGKVSWGKTSKSELGKTMPGL